jgi:uncharacterized membrane protein YphA (DoxX/SURF4 family)
MSHTVPVIRKVLWWLLALSFVAGAITKFADAASFAGDPYSVKFVEWGYPSWFRFLVGTGELVGAALLVIPRRRLRFLGSTLLAAILVGAVITHIVNTDPIAESIMAPTMLAITGTLAWKLRPQRWTDLLSPFDDHPPATRHELALETRSTT